MADMQVTPIGITGGVWSAVITDAPEGVPQLTAHHAGRAVPDVKVREGKDGDWLLDVPIPPEAISDGVQTFVISDTKGERQFASFTVLAGDALDHDIRAELDLLRAELDMLKRAFRRHCSE